MDISFFKYQGTGNDFIIVDDRDPAFPEDNPALIARLCDRRFGIGADGLILLQTEEGYDFRMIYFNADGRQSSMCGNGGRCIAAFAHRLGLGRSLNFIAIDGPHSATVDDDIVDLKMTDVSGIQREGTDTFILNTGSPHYVNFRDGIDLADMVKIGREVRYSPAYAQEGINVNIAENILGEIKLRTYERGVEDETLSCGTGTVATALAYHIFTGRGAGTYSQLMNVAGGRLQVSYHSDGRGNFHDIWLAGPAKLVFSGEISI